MIKQPTNTVLPFRLLATSVFAVLGFLLLAVPSGSALAAPQSPDGATSDEMTAEDPPPTPPSLLGPVSREQVEAAEPGWVAEEVEAQIDEDAARALAEVEPGAKVVIYFGTWCSDSRRELSRFWRALDVTGSQVPFELEYIAVDRSALRPPEMEKELGLVYVPTFIVSRGGEEVGRMVEESPNGIEHDLLALLRGDATGVISTRDDVGAGAD